MAAAAASEGEKAASRGLRDSLPSAPPPVDTLHTPFSERSAAETCCLEGEKERGRSSQSHCLSPPSNSRFRWGEAKEGPAAVRSTAGRDQSSSATYYYKENPTIGGKRKPPALHKEWIYYRKLKPDENECSLRRQQVQQRADECIRALDLLLEINSGKPVKNILPLNFNWSLLKDSIDLLKIAAMGHSFGAATVIETLSKDARFKCGVALDAWMLPLTDEVYSKVHQPLLFINSEKYQWASNILEMKKLNYKYRDRKMITIKGTVHQSFPDFTFLTGNIAGKIFKLKGDIDPETAIDISNKASLAFLQKHLGLCKDFNQWNPLLNGEGCNVIPDTNVDLTPGASQ